MTRVSKIAVAAISLLFCCGIAQATNPNPTITSFSPPSVYQDGPSFTLTVKGTGFISSTLIYWNNSALVTTYVSSTQVTAEVPGAYLIDPTTIYVYANNPPPGGGNSPSLQYSVIALDPSVSSVGPDAVVAGSGATSITVDGYNFMSGASVLWNGKKLPTTYVNSGELEAQLSASAVSKPTIAQVSVSNPPPGGVSGISNFNVTYPAVVRILNLPANDIIWNPNTQQIYASLPSSFGPNGNSVAVINPTKGTVSGYYYVGSEPNQLALSADGSYLYVGLNGNGSIQRMVLPSFALDINIPLGTIEYGGVNTAGAIQVSPSNSHTIAVALSSAECCGYGGPLEFFTDTTQLPDSITYPDVSSIQFVSGTTLYGYYSSQLIEVTVNSSGGTVAQQWNDMITGSSIAYDAGLIYGNGGQVFNPVTSDLVGSYDVGSNDYGSGEDLLPESAVNSTFVVGISPFFSSLGITSYNLSHFTPTAVINLSQLSGTVSAPFISWGTNGLAFVIGNGCCGTGTYQTVLVQSSMMEQHSTKH